MDGSENEGFPEDDMGGLLGSDSEGEEEEGEGRREDDQLTLDDLYIPDTIIGPSSADIDPNDLLFPLPIESDCDSDSSDEEKKSRNKVTHEKVKNKRNFLDSFAPGINLFCANGENEEFSYFTMKTLDIERDLGYRRRAKLLGHGFTNDNIDMILKDRLQFVRHLMAEAQSVLICDKNDFRAVMNFLFYSISVCTDRNLNDLLTKSFFDLRKNYGFRWNLGLKHIFTVLLNYGAAEDVIYNERFINKDNVGIKKHLEEVRRSNQDASDKYQLPKLPGFFLKRRKDSSNGSRKHVMSVDRQDFEFVVSRFIILVSEFSAGLPSFLELRYRNNWSEQIIFLYIILLLGTDKHFIRNHRVKESVMSAIHHHLDSFTTDQWCWGPTLSPINDQSKRQGFNHSNVCKTLIRLVNEFFPGELCPEVVCWKDETTRMSAFQQMTNREGDSDHHLNMLHRIHLIPPSYRGTQVKKYLAYMYLQTLAEINFSLPTHVDVVELTDHPSLCDKLSDGLKMIVLSKNYGLITTVVELYDIIIGHQPELDFTPDKVPHVERVRQAVLGWIRKKMPAMGFSRDYNDSFVKGLQLTEYLDIVDGRWETQIMRNKR